MGITKMRMTEEEFMRRTFGPDDEIDAGELLPGFQCRVTELFELE